MTAEPLFSPQPVAQSGWTVTVKGTAEAGPRYPGSDEFGLFAYPSIGFSRIGAPKRFSAPDDGFGISVYDGSSLRVGVVGRYRGGRYFSDDHRLFGLEDVRWAVEPGLFLEYWPIDFLRTRIEVRRGFHGHEGFVADLGLDLVQPFGSFTFSVGPRLAFGDGTFTRAYFGVRPFEAALNGQLPAYRPSGGLTSVRVLSALTYDWSERWSTTVYASYHRLVSDAAQSPIVKRFGSENQFTIGATIAYSFDVAGW